MTWIRIKRPSPAAAPPNFQRMQPSNVHPSGRGFAHGIHGIHPLAPRLDQEARKLKVWKKQPSGPVQPPCQVRQPDSIQLLAPTFIVCSLNDFTSPIIWALYWNVLESAALALRCVFCVIARSPWRVSLGALHSDRLMVPRQSHASQAISDGLRHEFHFQQWNWNDLSGYLMISLS